ncbi:unnamed protein product [Calypogeia fissa]
MEPSEELINTDSLSHWQFRELLANARKNVRWSEHDDGCRKHKVLGNSYDLPRSSPSSLGGNGWIPAGLQKLPLAVVGLFLIPSILFAFVNVNDSSTIPDVLSQNDHHDSATGLRTERTLLESPICK